VYILEVRNANKSFGALHAVRNLSFNVHQGEIFGIAGPNGSGKSTLFNIITGIPFSPDEGSIVFNGRPVQHLRGDQIAHLGLARTFQKETEFSSLSVIENAIVAATFGSPETQNAEDKVVVAEEALNRVGLLAEQYKRPASELSTFEKKQLMVATALAMRPILLLLDEPASGLTKPEVTFIEELILKLNKAGITVVLIEHVLSLLLAVSHRIMVLSQGEELATGEPGEIIKDARVIEAYLGERRR
jgi:branched-chain amino acid transport system ATP-binding protein